MPVSAPAAAATVSLFTSAGGRLLSAAAGGPQLLAAAQRTRCSPFQHCHASSCNVALQQPQPTHQCTPQAAEATHAAAGAAAAPAGAAAAVLRIWPQQAAAAARRALRPAAPSARAASAGLAARLEAGCAPLLLQLWLGQWLLGCAACGAVVGCCLLLRGIPPSKEETHNRTQLVVSSHLCYRLANQGLAPIA